MSDRIYVSPYYPSLNAEKWARHYWKLCNRAMFRALPEGIYTEAHHVFPKCIYGKNNIVVNLTAEEHYVAHQLLVKMYPTVYGLVYAVQLMSGDNTRIGRNNKSYEVLRNPSDKTRHKMSESQKGRTHSEETCRKISEGNKGKVFSEERCRNISESRKGHVPSEDTRRKLSRARQGNTNAVGTILSGEMIQKMKEGVVKYWKKCKEDPNYVHPLKGRKLSPEIVAKRVLSRKNNKNNANN